jgi:hypothetical protein
VTLSSNTGATINFTNGGLDIDCTSGIGFTATGGGTISVQGTGNSITTTTGTALNVVNTTIGSPNLNFQSISAGTISNSAGTGISLDNTGVNGGLTVTGSGSAGSGGTIQHKTGGDGATAGIGIYLNNTRNISLSRMQLNDFDNFALRGNTVVGFTMDNTVISGVNGNNDGSDEGSISFNNLTGSASITNCNISGGHEDNVKVLNNSGSLNRFTVSNTTIGANSTNFGSDGMFLEASAGASINATIQNSFFTSSRGDLFQFNQNGTGTSDLILSGNAFSDNHPNIVAGGGTVNIGGINGTFTFNVNNNTFRDATGSAFALSSGGTAACVASGTISNNQVGVLALANSGSTSASGIAVVNSGGGTTRVNITNNIIRQYNNHGILLQAGQTLGNPVTFELTVTGNTISTPGNINTEFNGIAGENFISCVHISGNTLTGSGNGVTFPNNQEFRIRQRQSTTVRLPGYGGANNNDAAVVTFLQGQNTVTGGNGAASNTVSTGGGGFVGGAACALPAFQNQGESKKINESSSNNK